MPEFVFNKNFVFAQNMFQKNDYVFEKKPAFKKEAGILYLLFLLHIEFKRDRAVIASHNLSVNSGLLDAVF